MYKTTKEIAEHYGVTRQAIEKWIKRGDIPHEVIKVIGKKPTKVYTLEQFEAYLASKSTIK